MREFFGEAWLRSTAFFTMVVFVVVVATSLVPATGEPCNTKAPTSKILCLVDPTTCEDYSSDCSNRIGIYDIWQHFTDCSAAGQAQTDHCTTVNTICATKYYCEPDDWDTDSNCEKGGFHVVNGQYQWVYKDVKANTSCTVGGGGGGGHVPN